MKKVQFQTPTPHACMLHVLLLGVVVGFGFGFGFGLAPTAAEFGQLEPIDP